MFTQFRNTSEWGPSFWYVFHSSAMLYPDRPTAQLALQMTELLTIVPDLLPCPSCQQHARDYIDGIASLSNVCSSRTNLFEFWATFHNAVNERLGKRRYEFATVYHMYSSGLQQWGPPYWFFLHMTSFAAGATKPRVYKRFLQLFPILLPTSEAKQLSIHYIGQQRLDWVSSSDTNIFYFWFQFHNYINAQLGKKMLAFERVKELYKIN